jgi:DNA-binding MarR family transcriptional regulator
VRGGIVGRATSVGYDTRVTETSGTTGHLRDLDLGPWRAFLRAHARVARRLDEDLRNRHALSLQEYETLLHLAEAPERRLRMGRLADSLLLSKSGVTRLVDRLVDDGLVERTSCSSDARGAEASLTGTGLARLRAAAPTHLAGIRDHFYAAIASPDVPVVERAMDAISERIGSCPGSCEHAADGGAPATAGSAASPETPARA